MTVAQIKAALRRNRKAARRPWSLNQLARMRGCDRSVMTRALSEPTRYWDAREFIESALRDVPPSRKKAGA